MAYSFGGGVRPELGRTDFTPFLQGSVQGAKMQAKGAESMAAGVSQFLAKAGEGVKAYQENKAINTMFNGTIDQAIKINEEGGGELARMLKIADPSDRGAWSAAVKSLGEGDKKKGSMAVRTFMMQMAQQEAQRERMQGVIDPSLSPEENVQRAIAAGASVGEASALGNFLTNAQQARNPPPPKLDQFGRMVQADIDAFEATNGRPPTPQETAEIYRNVQERGRSPTIINMPGERAQGALYQRLGEKEGDAVMGIIENANKGEEAITKLTEVLRILDDNQLSTGIFANVKTTIDRLRSQLLGDEEAAKRVTNDQIIDALLGSDVFPLIGELGIGARGIDTPAERDFLIAVFTGRRELNLDTLKQMTQYRYNSAVRKIEAYNQGLENGRLNPFFEISGLRPEPRIVPKKFTFSANDSQGKPIRDLQGNPYTQLSKEDQALLDRYPSPRQ